MRVRRFGPNQTGAIHRRGRKDRREKNPANKVTRGAIIIFLGKFPSDAAGLQTPQLFDLGGNHRRRRSARNRPAWWGRRSVRCVVRGDSMRKSWGSAQEIPHPLFFHAHQRSVQRRFLTAGGSTRIRHGRNLRDSDQNTQNH